MARKKRHTKRSAEKAFAELTFQERIVERHYRRMRIKQRNEQFVRDNPSIVTAVLEDMKDPNHNKAHVARKHGISHSRAMWIWVHHG